MPQQMFCTAMAKAKVSRVQPRSIVIGASQNPKPWRMPIDTVTMAAPQISTWRMDSGVAVMWEVVVMAEL